MPAESETGWQEVMDDLKARGLKRVLMFVSDELLYLERVIDKTFPDAKLQNCIVHKKRNLLARVKRDDKLSVRNDLKNIMDDRRYTLKEAKTRTKVFMERWKKNILHSRINGKKKISINILPA